MAEERTSSWKIEAKAPGKMILLGEYTVLYGNVASPIIDGHLHSA